MEQRQVSGEGVGEATRTRGRDAHDAVGRAMKRLLLGLRSLRVGATHHHHGRSSCCAPHRASKPTSLLSRHNLDSTLWCGPSPDMHVTRTKHAQQLVYLRPSFLQANALCFASKNLVWF